jgi:D-glycero-D-manno-heptose 1,7-bisphosphate phosphatase
MLLQAALDHHIDLRSSYAIGDKKSDILAGQAAGCSTILVLTGAAGSEEPDLVATPDYIAHDLLDAALMIQKAELRTAQQ